MGVVRGGGAEGGGGATWSASRVGCPAAPRCISLKASSLRFCCGWSMSRLRMMSSAVSRSCGTILPSARLCSVSELTPAQPSNFCGSVCQRGWRSGGGSTGSGGAGAAQPDGSSLRVIELLVA